MNLDNFIIDISQTNNRSVQSIQSDVNSRFVNATVVNNGKKVDLTGYLISLACKKPDGKIVFNETELVDAKQGVISFEISEQMTSTVGDVACEFKIYGKNGSVLTTQYFTVSVTQPTIDKNIQSSNEFRQLTIAMNEFNKWINNFDDKMQEITTEFDAKLAEESKKFESTFNAIETKFDNKYTSVTNQFQNKYDAVSNQFQEKYDGLEQEYAEELTSVKSGLEETNAQLSEKANKYSIFYTTPQDFKSLVVDGDWTEAIQKALDCRGTVYIPNGEYMITKPLNVYGGTRVIGESVHPRGSLGARLCASFIGEYFINIVKGDDESELEYAEDVELNSLYLANWNAVNIGIYSKQASRLTLSSLYIKQFTNKGVYIEDAWVNTFEKITVIGQGSNVDSVGFDLFGTSYNINNCYVFNCRNGYKLDINYSTISACASDHIGNSSNYGIVYDLGGYNTGLLNCGAEQCYGTLVRASERSCHVKGMSSMTHYIKQGYPLFSNYKDDKVCDSLTIEDVSVVFRDLTTTNGEKIFSLKPHKINIANIDVKGLSIYQNNQSFEARKINVYEYRVEYLGNKSLINLKNHDFINNSYAYFETLSAFDKVKYIKVRNGSYISISIFNENADDTSPYRDDDVHCKIELVCRTNNAYIYNETCFGNFRLNIYNDNDETNSGCYSIIALHLLADCALTQIGLNVSSTDIYDLMSKFDVQEDALVEKQKVYPQNSNN
nr:MAG TPA: Baseplate component [Caudoviricetes sp.]